MTMRSILVRQTKTEPGGAVNTYRAPDDSLGDSKEPRMGNLTRPPHVHTTPSTTDAKLGKRPGKSHPVNLFILPDDRQLPDAFVQTLRDLDERHEALQWAFHEAVASAVATAFQMDGWDEEVANRFMLWIIWAYKDVPDEYLRRQFTKMTPEHFAEVRRAMLDEANELLDRKMLQRMKRMPYADYLQTDHWQDVRKAALKAAEYRCQLCNADTTLHVHHRTYERRGEESPADLIALCADCHQAFHDRRKVSE